MYGIPSTTLWQRAHRLGIDTPKKEGAAKSWSEADLRGALHALRAGAISANKASKAYGEASLLNFSYIFQQRNQRREKFPASVCLFMMSYVAGVYTNSQDAGYLFRISRS